MKRVRNLVLGGIENKVFNLILFTVILVAAAFSVVSLSHSNMLSKLSTESSRLQQEAVGEITESVVTDIVDHSMTETALLESIIADGLFSSLETRVRMLEDYAAKVFASPEDFPRAAFSLPDPARDGEVTAQVILAEGLDPDDAELKARLGTAANLTDLMVSQYGVSENTNSVFVALPEGACLIVDDRSAVKFDESGKQIRIDPRTRPWYIQAVEAGGLIFTDVEVDVFTGDIGVVCAMPVYADGELAAVVGSDLFLTSMRDAVMASGENSDFICVVNQNGHVVFAPEGLETFRVAEKSDAVDLRESGNAELAALVSDAMRRQADVRLITLDEGEYYMSGAPLPAVGWALLLCYSREEAVKPTQLLQKGINDIQEEAVEKYRESTGRSRTVMIVLLVCATLITLAAALVLSRKIVKPLNEMTKRISGLREGDPEFRMEDTFRTGDEIEVLAESFADISHKTVIYIDQVRRVTAEKERIGTELSMATRIQAAMLPHIFPAFPDRPEVDVYASMGPAREVGGDFYDFFWIDDDHLCCVIADVSGKGVPAALFMMASKIILQSCAKQEQTAAEILRNTNETICSNNYEEMFVTVWLGIFEISTGKLSAANAGHEYPIIKKPGGVYELYRDRHNFVLGGFPETEYAGYELVLEPGTKIFVYTDGVTEAANGEMALFGTQRIVDALNSGPDTSAKAALENVQRAVQEFTEGEEQFDDLTMLCLEYKGPVSNN